MLTQAEKAYAKINFYLDVIGKREDGFHNIESVMQTVSLYDTLNVSYMTSKTREVELIVSFDGISEELSSGEDNLACRAARLYLDRRNIFSKIKLELIKRIPIAAGLGGGSADAAAALRALNRIFGAYTQEELLSLAGELGSDVPFCLFGGTAFCEGKGERIRRVSYPGGDVKLHFVIAAPCAKVSTPEAYAELDEIYGDFVDKEREDVLADFNKFISAVKLGIKPKKPLYNVFERSRASFGPESERAKSVLLKTGALVALMTGSGPACFGVFDIKSKAESAKIALTADGIRAWYAEGVSGISEDF